MDEEPSKPLYRYWWFWLFVAMVVTALLRQVGGVALFGEEEAEDTNTSMVHALCNLAFPCGLVWDLTAPASKPPAIPTRDAAPNPAVAPGQGPGW